MAPKRIDFFLERHSRWFVTVGAILFALGLTVWGGVGAVSGWIASWMGLSGVVVQSLNWRTQRGLWVLATVLLFMGAFSWGLLEAGFVGGGLGGGAWQALGLGLDGIGGLLLLNYHCQFLITVARQNWSLTHGTRFLI